MNTRNLHVHRNFILSSRNVDVPFINRSNMRDFDVIVIGGGASGGTLAADLAMSGSSVLVLERGQSRSNAQEHDELATLIDKRPYDDRFIDVNQQAARLYMGAGPGGGTSVYGGALLRPSEGDFHPGKYYSARIDRSIWDWPIDYATLAPHYARAEALFNVSCDANDNLAPLQPTAPLDRNPPLPLAPINKRLVERTRLAKLNPFRLPLGIETSKCLKCSHCAGFPCPTRARTSSGELLTDAVNAGKSVTVLCNREVTKLERKPNARLGGVRVLNRETNEEELYTASRYVLAAGAIGSPCILQRSGFEHEQLGRNYMMHYSPLAVGIFARKTQADHTFVKQIGFADYYFGTDELPEKMGILQSLPAPGPLMLQKTGLKLVPKFVLNSLRRHMLPFVGIVEDLPNPANRVMWSDNGIQLTHAYSDYDKQRGTALTRAMVRMLKIAGAFHCVTKEMPSREHVAHQCGTVRFGSDSKHAVVNPDCRVFGQDDLFVVDGSILPTSLGVGPSLTLIANSLRVANVLRKEI